LKPLPILEWFRSDILLDFITKLPARYKGDNIVMIVGVDRLGKEVIVEPIASIDAEACAKRFFIA
jgi:hypothetical protein